MRAEGQPMYPVVPDCLHHLWVVGMVLCTAFFAATLSRIFYLTRMSIISSFLNFMAMTSNGSATITSTGLVFFPSLFKELWSLTELSSFSPVTPLSPLLDGFEEFCWNSVLWCDIDLTILAIVYWVQWVMWGHEDGRQRTHHVQGSCY